MRVLVACEFSGTVRDAFIRAGHDAISCDLLPSDKPGPHIQGDVTEVMLKRWDLVVAHPPCTYLTVSGNKWMKPEYRDRFPDRPRQREEAIKFFMACYNANADYVAVENPIGIMSSTFRKPDQIVQPWMFGHPETKATCFWLRGLPKLSPTSIVDLSSNKAERHRLLYLPPSEDRWKIRSKTFQGIADAMAAQWGFACG
jgi:hypothetical protein